jgi:hypothetical protein
MRVHRQRDGDPGKPIGSAEFNSTDLIRRRRAAAARRMGAGHDLVVAVLRDADLRSAPQAAADGQCGYDSNLGSAALARTPVRLATSRPCNTGGIETTLPDTPRIDCEVIASFAEMATSFANQLRLSVIDFGGSSFWFALSWNRTFVNGIVFVARSKSPTRARQKDRSPGRSESCSGAAAGAAHPIGRRPGTPDPSLAVPFASPIGIDLFCAGPGSARPGGVLSWRSRAESTVGPPARVRG